MASTMASPMAASAAASTITKIENTCPGQLPRPLHEVVEGDEVDVGGVEDQLDPHQDAHRVPPGDHRHHAQREQGGADDEEVRQADRALDHWRIVSEVS